MAISPEHPRNPIQDEQSRLYHEGLGKKIQLLEASIKNVIAVKCTYPNISNEFLKKDEGKMYDQALNALSEYLEQIKRSRLY